MLVLKRYRQEDQAFKVTPWLFREFEASLGSMRPCVKTKLDHNLRSPLTEDWIENIGSTSVMRRGWTQHADWEQASLWG